MKKRILIDAGHFGKYNPYNVLLPARYSEAEMAWTSQGLLKLALEAYGFEVGTTRTDPSRDLDVVNRGRMAKGYDLLLSLHSNACGTETVNRAVMCVYNDRPETQIDNISCAVGEILGETVKEVMGLTGYQLYSPIAPFDRDGNGKLDDPYYGILYGAFSVGVPAVIVEHSFHTNKMAAKWLSNPDNLKGLAQAEAAAIAKFFGARKVGDVNGDGTVNSLDAAAVLKSDAGLIKLTEEQKKAADVNGDGRVNSLDAAAILGQDAGI